MPSVQISKEEMLKRVARFKGLQPSKKPLLDTRIPGHEREAYRIIVQSVSEDPDARPAIADPHDFNLGLNKAGPGKRAALHSHPTVEVFIPLSGEWAFSWGDKGENEITLGPWDTISIPPGVMRGFRNVSDEDAYLLAVVGGGEAGPVTWPAEVQAQARDTGLRLDEQGNLIVETSGP